MTPDIAMTPERLVGLVLATAPRVIQFKTRLTGQQFGPSMPGRSDRSRPSLHSVRFRLALVPNTAPDAGAFRHCQQDVQDVRKFIETSAPLFA